MIGRHFVVGYEPRWRGVSMVKPNLVIFQKLSSTNAWTGDHQGDWRGVSWWPGGHFPTEATQTLESSPQGHRNPKRGMDMKWRCGKKQFAIVSAFPYDMLAWPDLPLAKSRMGPYGFFLTSYPAWPNTSCSRLDKRELPPTSEKMHVQVDWVGVVFRGCFSPPATPPVPGRSHIPMTSLWVTELPRWKKYHGSFWYTFPRYYRRSYKKVPLWSSGLDMLLKAHFCT